MTGTNQRVASNRVSRGKELSSSFSATGFEFFQ